MGCGGHSPGKGDEKDRQGIIADEKEKKKYGVTRKGKQCVCGTPGCGGQNCTKMSEGKTEKCEKCANCDCKGKGCVKCNNCKDCNPVDKSKKVSEQMTDPDAPMSVSAKPDFPDVDGDGDTKEPISKASKEKKEKEGDDPKNKGEKPKKGEVPPQLKKHVEKKKKGQNESKIYTPEQEQELYESRFNNRNDRIFDKLKKLWTK